MTLAVVAAGGALGTAARDALGTRLAPSPGSVPWVTLATNLAGAFLLGLGAAWLVERGAGAPWVRPFALIGVLGSFTTFSTVAVGADLLIHDGAGAAAGTYLGVSVLGGILAAAAGLTLGRLVPTIRRKER